MIFYRESTTFCHFVEIFLKFIYLYLAKVNLKLKFYHNVLNYVELLEGYMMLVKLKRTQKHTVVYTDEYEMSEIDFKRLYKSEKNFFLMEEVGEEIEEYHINSLIDDVSNRKGTYEEDWEIEFSN